MNTKYSKLKLLLVVCILLLGTVACESGPTETDPSSSILNSFIDTSTPDDTDTTEDLGTTEDPGTSDPITYADLQAATVQIIAKTNSEGRLTPMWTGSGTVLCPDGLILTNAHVASPREPALAAFYRSTDLLLSPDLDSIVISFVYDPKKPPIETYVAEVVAADGPLDLAVLKIVETVDGKSVDPSSLDLPCVEVGDSDKVKIGDSVTVLGFPGIGGDTITQTQGIVSGFESQDRIGDGVWIKTDSTVAPGNSGGLAANQAGEIIGVPSMDVSIKAGSIDRIRVINLAKPMLDAARSGRPYISPYVVRSSGNESFTLEAWSMDFDEEYCPINPGSSIPSSPSAVVANFKYSGLTDGEDYLEIVLFNGSSIQSYVLDWQFGSSGNCWPVYVSEADFGNLPDGVYSFYVFAGEGGDMLEEAEGFAEIEVGGDISDPGGVHFIGQIVDGDSGAGIPEAFIAVFEPGTDIDEWLKNPLEGPLLFYEFADQNGYYDFSYLLPRGPTFILRIEADGYNSSNLTLTIDQGWGDEMTINPIPLFK